LENKLNKATKLQLIRKSGIIAILRAKSSGQLIAAADAIHQGGIQVIEVSMTTPGALKVIETAATHFGEDVLFGVGSVLDPEAARQAISAGAGFVVSPTLKIPTIEYCNQSGIPVIPGCLTPTEILTAWEAGADMVKVFPSDFSGAKYIRAIRAPLPHIELVAVGGVDLSNMAEYFKAGVVAVGIGSSLINQVLLDKKDMAELTRRASAFVAEVKNGRGEQN
jgi:2-dehydro-3-deoxyphosphogluconate aldolase / (4S)-4-hydroxy-2-oxoglutarate aldolase